MKLDLASVKSRVWSAAPGGLVSERTMVPRPGATAEDDGWVLGLVWNGARSASDLVLLDTASMREEAVLFWGRLGISAAAALSLCAPPSGPG